MKTIHHIPLAILGIPFLLSNPTAHAQGIHNDKGKIAAEVLATARERAKEARHSREERAEGARIRGVEARMSGLIAVVNAEERTKKAHERTKKTAEDVRGHREENADNAKETRVNEEQAAEAARERANDKSERGKETAENAKERAKELAEEARERGQDTAENAKERGKEVTESAKERANDARQNKQESVDKVRDRAIEARENGEEAAENARESAAEARESGQKTAGSAKDRGNGARESREKAVESAKERAKEHKNEQKTVENARERAKDLAEDALERGQDTSENAKDRAAKRVDETRKSEDKTAKNANQRANKRAKDAGERAKKTAENARERAEEARERRQETAENANTRANKSAKQAAQREIANTPASEPERLAESQVAEVTREVQMDLDKRKTRIEGRDQAQALFNDILGAESRISRAEIARAERFRPRFERQRQGEDRLIEVTPDQRRAATNYYQERLYGRQVEGPAPEFFRRSDRRFDGRDPRIDGRNIQRIEYVRPRYLNEGRRYVHYDSRASIPAILMAAQAMDYVRFQPTREIAPIFYDRQNTTRSYAMPLPPENYRSADSVVVSYPVDESSMISSEDILFLQGSTQFSDPYSYEVVSIMADAMKAMPEEERFVIEGHASAEGSYENNMVLSQQRAEHIVREIVRRGGVSPSRLIPVGYGESEARHPADAAEVLRSQDRRVVVFRMKPEAITQR